MGQNKANAFARSEHAALLAAIVAVLVAGIVAAFLLPTGSDRRAARENGSLLAPPSDDGFSAAFGAPGVPSSSIGVGEAGVAPGSAPAAPSPKKPSPAPAPGTPPPPPDEGGLLGLLDRILPPPPPLPGIASAHAVERVAAVR